MLFRSARREISNLISLLAYPYAGRLYSCHEGTSCILLRIFALAAITRGSGEEGAQKFLPAASVTRIIMVWQAMLMNNDVALNKSTTMNAIIKFRPII